MNFGKLHELALRYAQARTSQAPAPAPMPAPAPNPAIPVLPPGYSHPQAGPGMQFNPNVQLDPSQVEDRRGWAPAPPPLNQTTTTGTIPQSGQDYLMALAAHFNQLRNTSGGEQHGKQRRRH